MEQEEVMNDEDRLAILSQVFTPKSRPNTITEKQEVVVGAGSTPPSSHVGEKPNDSKETSPSELESFGSLLEKTLVKRNVQDKQQNDVTEKDRKMAIDESRQDLIGDMVKVLFR